MEKPNIPLIFLFLVLQDRFCPVIFGRPFLNTVNAKIDYEKNVVTIGLGDMSHEFNFSKFRRQHREEELPIKMKLLVLLLLPYLLVIL